jgi:hypothetical protein
MKQKISNQITIVLLSLCVINILLLDLWIFINNQPVSNVLGTTDTASVCPQSCLREIQKYSGSSNSVKELFVPLGSGSGYSTDWTDVPGVYTSINRDNYSRIKSVAFEVTVNIPSTSQTVWVRLYNSTDKHPVWYSEVSSQESGPKTLTSQPIALDPGLKEYQVQLKTQLGGLVNISNARIRITTN